MDLKTISAKAAKVAAAYAAYKKARTSFERTAINLCHTWRVDGDYLPNTFEAAKGIAKQHRFTLPGQRKHTVEHRKNRDKDFASEEWAWLAIPGASRFVQVRTAKYDPFIEFRSPLARDLDVVRALVEAAQEEEEDDFEFDPLDLEPTTNIMAWSEKEGWSFRKQRTSRSFRSVFLPAELQAEIESDLSSFTASRERLQRLEMPWRRGYLLSGPPGTGKTSLSLAIAGALGFNLASLSLTDIKSDGDLRQAVSQLRARTVLVVEDIDAYSISRDRDHNNSTDGALSLSGLLNSIDGFETPDGLVLIATTNHIEHLDPALVRAGRFDRTFHLGHIEAKELERLFKWFYEESAPSPAPEITGAAGIAPAQVAELFKQHLNEPEGGWARVLKEIEDRTRLEVAA